MMDDLERHGVEHQPTPDSLGEYASLLLDVQGLINTIDVAGEIDTTNSEEDRTFLFEIFGDHQIAIPKIAQETLGQIDQIAVTLTRPPAQKNKNGEIIAQPTALSINLINKDFTLHIYRPNDNFDSGDSDTLIDTRLRASPHTNLVHSHDPKIVKPIKKILNVEEVEYFENRLQEVSRVSDSDINQLMLSLMFPGIKLKDDQNISEASIIGPDAFDVIKDSLYASSISQSSTLTYLFTTSDSDFHYRKINGNTVSFTLTYIDERTGERITFDSRADTHYKAEPTHHITTYEKHFGVEGESVAPYYLAPEEYKEIHSLIQTEIHALNHLTPHMISTEETADTIAEIGTEDTNLDDRLDKKHEDLFRKRYTEGILTTLENDIAHGIIEDLDF